MDRLAGEGEVGPHGTAPGDLYIIVSIASHQIFQRDGANIFCRVPISFTTAALGDERIHPLRWAGALISLAGIYQTSSLVALICTTGIILGAAYMLYLYRRVAFGGQVNEDAAAMREAAEMLAGSAAVQTNGTAAAPRPLRPGDPVGVALMSGDLELGATGTVTQVEGNRVYAFGHPFYGLGPTQFPMTRAYVHTLLPSLASSFKIASTGEVIGTFQQDRATTIAGTRSAGRRSVPPRSRRSKQTTPTAKRATARNAGPASDAQSKSPASGT